MSWISSNCSPPFLLLELLLFHQFSKAQVKLSFQVLDSRQLKPPGDFKFSTNFFLLFTPLTREPNTPFRFHSVASRHLKEEPTLSFPRYPFVLAFFYAAVPLPEFPPQPYIDFFPT